ncbi:LacI family transcriptional regulator [Longispora fulva]|uniref:DNA-binding LacI/PurR family transcriptional regulator n=1 Tax=Longispora fulva TaxID=619741 RepID=A0A8J7G9V4_9ACTN|nr:substrate-binding domain-containing protein [Longispora fulva]MBG6135155.1 DNA-binding LacI/PurR family transcriptional regulator [Longispora fulva]GIG56610.1 LacI family transcriptional regulator [Longispora fulva]
MEAVRRHQAILLALRRDGSVRVADLVTQLGVSPITVRRDLAELEHRGLISRVHGGAVPPLALRGTATGTEPPVITGRRPTIGMMIPATSQYFREVVEGARRAAQAHDIRLVLAVSDYNVEGDRLNVQRLLDARIDGLLLTPSAPFSRHSSALDWTADLPVPVLFVERYHSPAAVRPVEFVASDHQHGALQAMRHLAELGHRRVALMTCASPTSDWITLGYDAALGALDLADAMPRHENRTREELLGDLDLIMDAFAASGVTAVLAHPDDIAIQVVQRARQRGMVVPDDLSVVAYNDEIAGLADIPLTAVAPAREDVGRLAVEFLLRKLHSGRTERAALHVHVLPRVIVRASTTRPRPAGPESAPAG